MKFDEFAATAVKHDYRTIRFLTRQSGQWMTVSGVLTEVDCVSGDGMLVLVTDTGDEYLMFYEQVVWIE